MTKTDERTRGELSAIRDERARRDHREMAALPVLFREFDVDRLFLIRKVVSELADAFYDGFGSNADAWISALKDFRRRHSAFLDKAPAPFTPGEQTAMQYSSVAVDAVGLLVEWYENEPHGATALLVDVLQMRGDLPTLSADG